MSRQLPSITVVDIRSSKSSPLETLDADTLEGLRGSRNAKTLPSLLLWDEAGQELYDKVAACPEYYPYRVERELLNQRLDEISATLAGAVPDVLIELGSGSMAKTAPLLAALDARLTAPVVYYALDVDLSELEASLSALCDTVPLRNITVRGLLGTYEDGADWLNGDEMAGSRRAVLWLGNSMANFDMGVAGAVLASFARAGNAGSFGGLLLGVDGCREAERICVAYNLPGGQTERWMKHALRAAAEVFAAQDDAAEAAKFFDADNWTFQGHWVPERKRFENYLIPTRNLHGHIQGNTIALDKGERVGIVTSGKWTRGDIGDICSKQGLDVQTWWNSDEIDYGAFPSNTAL